eukprot:scaffold74026_cov27-Tisochrysis_lutea.AAC.2
MRGRCAHWASSSASSSPSASTVAAAARALSAGEAAAASRSTPAANVSYTTPPPWGERASCTDDASTSRRRGGSSVPSSSPRRTAGSFFELPAAASAPSTCSCSGEKYLGARGANRSVFLRSTVSSTVSSAAQRTSVPFACVAVAPTYPLRLFSSPLRSLGEP